MTMTPEQIASAWALVNAATEGPWFAESGHEQGNGQLYWQVTDATDVIMQNQFCWCQGDHAANAAFIAASRELVPQLLTALEAERAKVARLVEGLEQWISVHDNCEIADGVCCCGDDMIGHSEPMSCGHVATDHGAYHAAKVAETTRALLTEIKETPHE